MVFCNNICFKYIIFHIYVTILILIDGFLQSSKVQKHGGSKLVTILILIDGFLQFNTFSYVKSVLVSHNPYFNRWFSAILQALATIAYLIIVTILILIDGFLQ